MPETRINTGFPKHFCLLKLNDCISVSTISCGFNSIKSTIFIHIIQAIFFYRKYLGQKLVITLYWNYIVIKSTVLLVPRLILTFLFQIRLLVLHNRDILYDLIHSNLYTSTFHQNFFTLIFVPFQILVPK